MPSPWPCCPHGPSSVSKGVNENRLPLRPVSRLGERPAQSDVVSKNGWVVFVTVRPRSSSPPLPRSPSCLSAAVTLALVLTLAWGIYPHFIVHRELRARRVRRAPCSRRRTRPARGSAWRSSRPCWSSPRQLRAPQLARLPHRRELRLRRPAADPGRVARSTASGVAAAEHLVHRLAGGLP